MEKSKKNLGKIFLFLFAIVALFSIVSAVSAAPVLVTPASSATVHGSSVVWNATNGSIIDVTSCSLWAKSASTANSTYVNISTAANESASAPYINGTFDSTALEDSNDYSFLVTCSNATAGSAANSTANTGVTIDNTVPTAPTSLSPTSTQTGPSVTFSATVSDAKTTGCTLFFTGINPGSKSYSMTNSGSSCSYTISNVPAQTYQYLVQATDGTNSTNSSSQTVGVNPTGNNGNNAAGYMFTPEAQNQAKTLTITGIDSRIGGFPIWVIVLIVALVVAVVIAARKK